MEIFDLIFDALDKINEFFWSYIGFTVICLSGLYLTIISRGKQFRVIFSMRKVIHDLIEDSKDKTKDGLNPFKLFFASVGGMVGIGNIVGVGMAVMIGGPGSIFWMWVASFCGMLIKYSEIYLGVMHRVPDGKGSYNGGPMYYLQDIFKSKFLAMLSAFVFCIYSIEIYQFTTIVHRFEVTFDLNRYFVLFFLLAVTLFSASGGVRRLANICTIIMPVFLLVYIIACIYILLVNFTDFINIFPVIFESAFTGHAAVGGFLGSSMLQAAQLGSSKAVYSGDIGMGYDSIVQSETRAVSPMKQGGLSILALFMDTSICTLSCLTLVVTGAWKNLQHLAPSDVMAHVFSNYFPFSEIFLTTLLFFAGFTTVVGYFTVGIKSATFLSAKYGKIIYFIVGTIFFLFFSNFNESKVFIIMNLTSGILVLLNVAAIIKMRNEIKFYDSD